jgi:hypothetical protein
MALVKTEQLDGGTSIASCYPCRLIFSSAGWHGADSGLCKLPSTTEAFSRVRIDSHLRDIGWKLTAGISVLYE